MENVNFLHIINRLKTVLGITKDKEVAEALGLKETALNVRKKRNSFPDRELRALAQQRPELGIDVDYVLTGQTKEAAVKKMVLNMGARFREVRGTRSVETFAQLLGTDAQTIHGIEAQTQLPSADLWRKLMDAHPDKDLIWLLGGEPPALDSPLTNVETILVMNYRASSKEGQAAMRRAAVFHATYQAED